MAVRADRAPRVYETWLPRARVEGRRLVVVFAATALIAGALAAATLVTVDAVTAQVPSVEFGPGKLPPLEQAVARKPSVPSQVLAADGSVIARFDPPERFRPIDPDHIPHAVVVAVTAGEDPTFFSHSGFVPGSIVRAAIENADEGRVVEGGSTITQQLAKNLYTDGQRTIGRKIRELLIAHALEQHYSKNQLLAAYLDTAYFGEGAVGISAAANTYFGKPVEALTLSEASMLAGLIPAPSDRDPRQHPDAAEAARREVIDRVAKLGGYAPADVVWATNDVPRLTATSVPTRYPYFVDYVRRWLTDVGGISPVDIDSSGLTIKTSLDPATQDAALAAVRDHLTDPNGPTGAVVVMDHRTGQVKAVASGTEWGSSQVNLALGTMGGGGGRQAGSAFKPFVLATALGQGFRPDSAIPAPDHIDVPFSDHPITNDSGHGYGTVSLTTATVNSINTAFTWLAQTVGPQEVANVATALGITGLPAQGAGPSIALGAYETSPLDMSAAFSAFAEDGRAVTPTPVVSVTAPDGRVLIDRSAPPPGKQIIDPSIARTITDMLGQVVARGTGTAAQIDRPVAGKTGTTDQHANAWFVGYSAQLTAAVWVGYPNGNIPMHDVDGITDVMGGTLPALIWHDVMLAAHHDQPVTDFPPLLPLPNIPRPSTVATSAPATSSTPHRPAPPAPVHTPTPAPAPAPATKAPPPSDHHKKKG